MTTRCVVFDVDDTLYLERDYVRSGFAAVGAFAAERLGVAGLGARALRLFEEGARGDIFDRALRDAGLAPRPALVTDLVRAYRTHVPAIALLPDARAALEDASRRCWTGVITDGPLESQRAKCDALQLSRWVKRAILTAELGPGMGKPHPGAFELMQSLSEVPGDRCAYVADNPAKDFAAPASLGWTTIRVRRPEGLHAAQPSGPDVQLETEDLSTLAKLLGFTR